MHRYPPDHPIWQIITHGMYGILITGCLYLNASSFDSTEISSIGQIFVAVGGAELIKSKIKKKMAAGDSTQHIPHQDKGKPA